MSKGKVCLYIATLLFIAAPLLGQSTIATGSAPLTNAGDDIALTTNSSGVLRVFNGASQLLRISSNGNVALGSHTPAVKLHVIGDMHVVGAGTNGGIYTNNAGNPTLTIKVNDPAAALPMLRFASETNADIGALYGWKGNAMILQTPANHWIGLRAGGSDDRLVVASNGWVGVGGHPGVFFHVKGNNSQYMLVERGTKALYVNANWAGDDDFAQIAARGGDDMGLSLSSNDSKPEYLYIKPDGTVGINTLVPNSAYKLNVNGNAHFNGTVTGTRIYAHYQDVAEWVPSRTDLEPGTLVVLDKSLGNGVAASTSPYDTTVAGVVSAEPGLLLGVAGDSKEQVATTGRVRVKARGPIAVGDLLVTSDKTGHAMRSTPIDVGGVQIHRPGTIVGKALEALAEGEGDILVLLSLQ